MAAAGSQSAPGAAPPAARGSGGRHRAQPARLAPWPLLAVSSAPLSSPRPGRGAPSRPSCRPWHAASSPLAAPTLLVAPPRPHPVSLPIRDPSCWQQGLGAQPIPWRTSLGRPGLGPAEAAALDPLADGPRARPPLEPARDGITGSDPWLICKDQLSCHRACPGPGCHLAGITPYSHVGRVSGREHPKLGAGRSLEACELAGSSA